MTLPARNLDCSTPSSVVLLMVVWLHHSTPQLSRASQKASFCSWVKPFHHLTCGLRAAGGLEGAATIDELMVGKHVSG